MTNPEEEIITFDTQSEQVVRHETVDGAENFAEEIAPEVYVQVVETVDLDNRYNTFRDE